jgi:hypothetical protein
MFSRKTHPHTPEALVSQQPNSYCIQQESISLQLKSPNFLVEVGIQTYPQVLLDSKPLYMGFAHYFKLKASPVRA